MHTLEKDFVVAIGFLGVLVVCLLNSSCMNSKLFACCSIRVYLVVYAVTMIVMYDLYQHMFARGGRSANRGS
jgi:undecaprenyl pyrophosphate phosphatase UppP